MPDVVATRRYRAACRALGAAVATVFLSAAGLQAQRVYSWKDERGVTHFADVPPKGVEFAVEDLPVPPSKPPPTQPSPAGTPLAGTPAAKKVDGSKPGEARVVIEEKSSQSGGGAVSLYSGRVKNVGGAEARNVRVTISVRETVQGADCLQDEITVNPANLSPDATGKFSAEFENPCFNGPTKADLRPEWD